MSVRTLSITTMVCILAASGTGRADELVTLTMQERLGLARVAEPVTIGVPLPQGAVKSATDLVVLSGGKAIPAEIRPIVKWPDGSIRWVHLYFVADCPATGQAAVALATGTPADSASRLVVDDAAEAITVNTGPLKFVVRKKGFNLIDSAQINGQPVISPHRRGAVLLDGDREYSAANDGDVKVVVEELGPMHAVILATGAHVSAGEKKLDFVCRIYAYSGSPVVRITYTFIMAQGSKIDDFIDLKSLHLEFPTVIRGGKATLGNEGAPITGKLKADDEAFVMASDSDTIQFGGAVSGSSKGKSNRPRRIGWANISDSKAGLAAGVRWFWQMHPKSVEVTGGGVVRVGLLPARANRSEKIFSGVARTHYVQLVFNDGSRDLAGDFAGLEDPLRPFAPARWYCRDTRAMGNLVEADLDLYKPEYRPIVAGWDKAFEANFAQFDKMMDGRKAGGDFRDDYGLLAWGDNFHYTKNATWGKMHEWNGNYYGYPHMMAVQFVRTGERAYFDRFDAHALHVADVHTVHYDPVGMRTGASRYCPPGDHVRYDRPPDYPVYIHTTWAHFKSEELFSRWYFTGDHRMLDVIAKHRRLVLEYKEHDRAETQPRGPGHLMITLAKFYEHTLDAVFLARCKEVFEKNLDTRAQGARGEPNFQQGMQLEGARRYYEISGDPRVLDYLKRWAGIFIETRSRQHTAAQAFGLLYARTGEPKYLELALRCIRRTAPDPKADDALNADPTLTFSKEKDFALTMRNGPYFLYYLSNVFPGPGK